MLGDYVFDFNLKPFQVQLPRFVGRYIVPCLPPEGNSCKYVNHFVFLLGFTEKNRKKDARILGVSSISLVVYS